MTEKPEIDFPGGEPPTDLQVTDVTTVGTGAEANVRITMTPQGGR